MGKTSRSFVIDLQRVGYFRFARHPGTRRQCGQKRCVSVEKIYFPFLPTRPGMVNAANSYTI